MRHIIDAYKEAYRQFGDSPAGVLWPKGRQNERFYALTREIPGEEKGTLLDFGCGLAHLREYTVQHLPQFQYHGVDVVDEFIQTNKSKFPDCSFQLIKNVKDIDGTFDHIVSSGAFNMLYTANEIEHKQIVLNILKELFERCNRSLSVNFMIDAVDFKQAGAYHQNVSEIYEFATSNLSRRLIINQSYMPYEFTLTIFKDQSIIRPENIYPSL